MFGAKKARGGAFREPGVRAFLLERISDASIDLLVDKYFLGVLIDEDRDRHAPGALARDHPIRTVGDHAADAVFARGRIPAGSCNFMQCTIPQRIATIWNPHDMPINWLIERDKPLRRVAENDRLFGAPGMRILVF